MCWVGIRDSAVRLVRGKRCCQGDWHWCSGKSKGTYCTGLGWGNELFLAGTSESTMKAQLGAEKKTVLPEGLQGGGKERRVHKCVGIDLTQLLWKCGWGGRLQGKQM